MYNALTIIDEKKKNIVECSIHDHLHHAIHFFGSLVQSAPNFDEPSQKYWKAKSSLRMNITSELSSSPHESLRTVFSDETPETSNNKSNSHSFGATTITTRENISTSKLTNILTCQCIVVLTTLFQKIGTELELLCHDPKSVAQSDYIHRLYLQ